MSVFLLMFCLPLHIVGDSKVNYSPPLPSLLRGVNYHRPILIIIIDSLLFECEPISDEYVNRLANQSRVWEEIKPLIGCRFSIHVWSNWQQRVLAKSIRAMFFLSVSAFFEELSKLIHVKERVAFHLHHDYQWGEITFTNKPTQQLRFKNLEQ